MLYLLTGQVQTGKTRWLQGLVSAYEARGVVVGGVLAPGIWRKVTARDGATSFEKLGIDNILLPEHETIPFASRRDLAVLDGTFDAESQSARAQLHWEISQDALARVNAHFEQQEGGSVVARRRRTRAAGAPARGGARRCARPSRTRADASVSRCGRRRARDAAATGA